MKPAAQRAFVPKLRFPEFRNEPGWRDSPLADVATFYNGRAFQQEELLEQGKYKVLRVGNFFTSNNWYYSDLELDETKYCDSGDLLYAWSASFGPRIWQGEKVIYHYHIWKVVGKDIVNQDFLYVVLNYETEKIKSQSANGLGLLHITKGTIESWTSYFPSRAEQKKITAALSSLDEQIKSQTQKLNALKTHKKGLMQQLFPAEGETLPKLRFAQFWDSGRWKKQTIGKALIEQSRPINMGDEEECSLVTVKRRYGGVVSRGTFKGKSIKVKTQFLLQENDFLISKRQIVHCACGVVPKYLAGSIVSNEYSVLRARDGFDISFLNYFAQQPNVSQSFLRCSIGIVIEKMLFKLNEWLMQEFLFPSLPEQQRIADCLSSLDELIAVQTQKLAVLKAHKKGLMQRLFPALDEVQG